MAWNWDNFFSWSKPRLRILLSFLFHHFWILSFFFFTVCDFLFIIFYSVPLLAPSFHFGIKIPHLFFFIFPCFFDIFQFRTRLKHSKCKTSVLGEGGGVISFFLFPFPSRYSFSISIIYFWNPTDIIFQISI